MKNSFIKKIISLLESSDLDSIQISSFWGMSKIKLFKSPSNQPSHPIIDSSVEKKNKSQSSLDISNDKIKEESLDSSSEIDSQSQSTLMQNEDNNLDLLDSHKITAPLVGTFYISPKAGDPPFIKIGDKIEVGQTLCIIEAMKIFNEIESEVSGVVKEILIENSSPVEYGQPILLIDINV